MHLFDQWTVVGRKFLIILIEEYLIMLMFNCAQMKWLMRCYFQHFFSFAINFLMNEAHFNFEVFLYTTPELQLINRLSELFVRYSNEEYYIATFEMKEFFGSCSKR